MKAKSIVIAIGMILATSAWADAPNADAAAPADTSAPTAAEMPAADAAPTKFQKMEENLAKMHALVGQMADSKDPAERQNLMKEYTTAQHENMMLARDALGMGGPGMSGTWGPGMAMPGYGMRPGMMGGYGLGYGMGPGMMGGYGPGYGVGPGMGGYGMGPGMMGEFWSQKLNLTDEQQAKIDNIMNETRRTHRAIMGQFMDDRAKLRDLYQEMAGLRQKMVDTALDAHRRMDAVLTPEQHKQVEAIRRGVMAY